MNQIQKNAQQQVQINKQSHEQNIQKPDKKRLKKTSIKSKNKSEGLNIKIPQQNIEQHLYHSSAKDIIINKIKLRQQKAEKSFIERYKKAREKRKIEKTIPLIVMENN